MSYTQILVERSEADASVVYVTLNRPAKRNALSSQLLNEYVDALVELRSDPDAKVIVTRGAGPSFCSGMDLHELGGWMAEWHRNDLPWSDAGPLVRAINEIRTHPCIMLASVHGYCAGGGLALVVAHELAVADASTRFILPETQRGSFGALAAAAMHDVLPRKWAFDIQLTGRELVADEARQLGLVSRVAETDLAEVTSEFAGQVASRNRVPLAHAKLAAYTGQRMTLEEAMLNDLLVGTRQLGALDSFADPEAFLASRRGSTGTER